MATTRPAPQAELDTAHSRYLRLAAERDRLVDAIAEFDDDGAGIPDTLHDERDDIDRHVLDAAEDLLGALGYTRHAIRGDEGQDRESYTDEQDRESYSTDGDSTPELRALTARAVDVIENEADLVRDDDTGDRSAEVKRLIRALPDGPTLHRLADTFTAEASEVFDETDEDRASFGDPVRYAFKRLPLLTWEDAGNDGPDGEHDQNADTLVVAHGYWSLGPNDPDTWSVELIAQDEDLDEIVTDSVHLGHFPTEAAAKDAAETYERDHRATTESRPTMTTMTETTCPRCKRPAYGWPVKRPDTCSPKHWAHCIRNIAPREDVKR
jgi:hypothetical protein